MIAAEVLSAHNASYGASWPGFLAAESERIKYLSECQARRPRIALGAARATLPISVVRRAQILEGTRSSSVLCVEDVDGLSLLLAARAMDVTAIVTQGELRGWLADEARRSGLSFNMLPAEPTAEGGFAAMVAPLGSPRRNYETVAMAARQVRVGGSVVGQLRAPWEGATFAMLRSVGMPVLQHWREVDLGIFATGLVVDGAGDVIVMERCLAVPRQLEDARAEAMRVQPYFWLDFDGLDRVCAEPASVEHLFDSVVAFGGYREAMRTVRIVEGQTLACWAGTDGESVSVQLTPGAGHVLLALMPFDERLEQAVCAAVAERLAGSDTRMRAHRSSLHQGESIVA